VLWAIRKIKNSLNYEANDQKVSIENKKLTWSLIRSKIKKERNEYIARTTGAIN